MVSVAQDVRGVERSFIIYRSGDEIVRALQDDPSFATRLLAVSGGRLPSLLSRTFPRDQQFAFDSLVAVNYEASLRNFAGVLDEESFHQWLPKLVSPFPEDPSQEDLRTYRAFFSSFGSHVVTGTTHGARSQLVSHSVVLQKV